MLVVATSVNAPAGAQVAEAKRLRKEAARLHAEGNLDAAIPVAQRSLAAAEGTLGPEHPEVASCLNHLAAMYQDKGDYARAHPLYERALTIAEEALGPEHPDVALSLNNVAGVCADMGDHARAEPLFLRALSVGEKALGPDHPAVGAYLNNLALLYWSRSEHERAEPLLERALAIAEARLGPEHRDVAVALNNLANLRVAGKDLARAEPLYRRALAIREKALGARHPDVAQALNNLAELHRRMGDPARAEALHGRALAIWEEALGPEHLEVARSLGNLAVLQAGQGEAAPEQYRGRLAALVEERRTLEAEVGARSAAFRAERGLVTLSEVQAAIPEGAALVELARYRPFHLHGADPAGSWGAPRYAAYVLRRGGDPAFADLGEAEPIEAAAAAARRAFADHDRTHDPRPAARALDRLVMQPVRALLGDTRWVLLSPDGPLHLVPFGALVDEQGHYLVERYLFSYLSAGRDLLRFGERGAAPREAPLVLADPAFDDSGASEPGDAGGAGDVGVRSIDMVTQRLPPLRSTAAEARTIGELFPGSRVLLGAGATEGALKAARRDVPQALGHHHARRP